MKSAAVLSMALAFSAGWLSAANAQTANGLVMNTPMQLVTCQNASLSWTGAPPGPVFVSVVPGGQPAAAPLVQFNATDSSKGSLVWLVDLPADTSVTVLITDMTGKSTGSAEVTIKKGIDTSCVGKGQSAHPGSTAAEPSTSLGSSPTTTTSPSTNTTTTSPSTSGSTTSGSTKPAASSATISTAPSSDSSAQTSTSTTKPDSTTNPSTSPTVVSTPAKTQTDGAVALQSQLTLGFAVLLLSALFMAI